VLLMPLLVVAQSIDLAVSMPATPGAGPSPAGYSYTGRIITDATGNQYVTGSLNGILNFGVATIDASKGEYVYIAKRSPAGAWLWAVPIRTVGNGNAYPTELISDGHGHLLVTGRFYSPGLALGRFSLTNTTATSTSCDIFVAMLDTDGNWQWATQAGGTEDDYSCGIAVARNGAVTIAGVYSRPGATFGTTSLPVSYPAAHDVFVAQLSPTGQWNWVVRGGGAPGSLVLSSLALDSQDNAYIAGSYSDNLQLGSLTIPNANRIYPDIFIAQISPTGTWLRANHAGGVWSENSGGIALDGQDNVYLTGTFESGTAPFGSSTIINTNPSGAGREIFVAKLGADNQWKWAASGGGAQDDNGGAIAVDTNANVYVNGTFFSAVCTFGTFQLTSANNFSTDMYTAKLDGRNGQWQWAIREGGTDTDTPSGLTCNDDGTVYFGGGFQSNPAAFGPFSLATTPYFASGFICRLQSPTVRVVGSELLCQGSQLSLTASTAATPVAVTAYQWSTGATTPTIIVSQPGTYTVTATFADGQHSSARKVVTTIATPAVRIDGDTVLCPSGALSLAAIATGAPTYTWSTGATTPTLSVTQPGTYTVTVSYGVGCAATATKTVRVLSARITGLTQLCSPQGSSTILTAVAPGASAFRWNTGVTTASLTVQQPGTYSVVANFPSGCSLIASQVVAVVRASIQGDSLLCPGKSLQLSAAAPTATGYLWSTGATTPTVTVAQPGRLSVVVSYPAGCTSRAQVQVRTAVALPSFTLGLDTVACEGQLVVLHGPVPTTGLTYRWSDGSSGSTLTVRQSGTYSLVVKSECEERTAQRTVSFASCVTIPNVITPNGDKYNELFTIQGLANSSWSLKLFDRWGTQVYQTASYQNEWGADALLGIYYYILQRANPAQSYKGWVEVIR